MKHLDLFSGIGGFALAARWANIETVAFCEIDPFCQKVLAKNFPNLPIHSDIKTLNGEDFAAIDIITGGYPCQPFSLAGKREGVEDDRHLWPEMRRIIAQAKPTWAICENVYGHVSMGLDEVITDLEALGYACQPFVVPAGAVGARHLRDRVWIVSYASSKRRQQKPCRAHGDEEENEGRGAKKHNELGGMVEAFRGASWWAAEPSVCKLANGLPSRLVRDTSRALGNAIVPQVAYELLRTISAT